MRLSAITLGALPKSVAKPRYDRDVRGTGIVHLGIGAFHRAHMGAYTDDVIAAGAGDWRILGASLRSPTVRDQLRPQDGLYTLVERSAAGSKYRVIGSVADALVASEQREMLVGALAAPTTHIASLTITEKGYCRAADGSLDLTLANHLSVYAYLAEALERRRDARIAGLTLLSCDNLSGNGAQLKRLMTEYLGTHAPDLAQWFEAECTCPSTMVDRIVPATTEEDRRSVEATLGLRDEAAVITEPFSQWVIEDNFAGQRPPWEAHGATIADDVRPYETAKLRMLNGAHSALAYIGLRRGFDYVHQAIADPELAALINRLMREEAATSLIAARGQDLDCYADDLIERFKNPALDHRLTQIAMDGSQKIPQRWLETLAFHGRNRQQCPAILAALSAWLRHIRGDNGYVDDPMAAAFESIWTKSGSENIVAAMFGKGGMMESGWCPTPNDEARILAEL